MKKINIDEKTRQLNEFRMANIHKSFSGKELQDYLYSLGISRTIASALMSKCFPYEKMGSTRIYEVPREPIHKSMLNGLYENFRNKRNKYNSSKKSVQYSQDSEEAALALLSARGYQIQKCVGFDLERFQKEQPILYKKYLKYETVQRNDC